MTLLIKPATSKDPGSIIALNANARFHVVKKNFIKPGKSMSQLLYLTENQPALLDTLSVVLLKNGETHIARRTIFRALARAPNNLTMRYHRAMIDATAGDLVFGHQNAERFA